MNNLILTCSIVICLETVLISLLMVMPKLGYVGKNIATACTKAPSLDVIVSALTWVPWVIGGYLAGWIGVFLVLIIEITVMQVWITMHESAHKKELHGPRIVGYLNQQFGWWRNHLGLWVTAIALPVFFAIRFAELFVYPFLIWLLGFPKYNHSEWINVSRQKFEGLIGHDLVWCWYCDWMTGVYALGAEMLRNVESFWCPIRFYDSKKCKNCKIDFPDIDGGWVASDGTMEEVVTTLDKHMPEGRNWAWFGHPERQNWVEK